MNNILTELYSLKEENKKLKEIICHDNANKNLIERQRQEKFINLRDDIIDIIEHSVLNRITLSFCQTVVSLAFDKHKGVIL